MGKHNPVFIMYWSMTCYLGSTVAKMADYVCVNNV